MRNYLIGACLACAAANPALAKDGDAENAPEGTDWSISASGGLTLVDGDGDQPFLRLGATRFIGDGYVRASVTRFSTRDGAGLVDTVPASTWQGSLAGGYSFGGLSIDAYASLGWREFDPEAYRQRTGQMIEIDSDGKTAGGGVSLTYEVELGESTFLSPFIAGDVNRVDTARAITVVGRGTISQKERQTGETGSLGFTLDHALGDSGSAIGAYAAFVATSNSAVAIRSSAPVAAARLFGPQDVPGSSDSWLEYGGSATLSLSEAVLLDFSVVRTAGFPVEESTSLSAGTRFRF
jgi:hypothetical protein